MTSTAQTFWHPLLTVSRLSGWMQKVCTVSIVICIILDSDAQLRPVRIQSFQSVNVNGLCNSPLEGLP